MKRALFGKTVKALAGPRDTLIPAGTEVQVIGQYGCYVEAWSQKYKTSVFTDQIEQLEVRDVEDTND